MKRSIWLFCFSIILISANSQQVKEKIKGWHLLDNEDDGYMGISLHKAYGLLQGKKSTSVIVAVIDSGIGTLHEGLKDQLWINKKEISGNGIDDDGNGYIDDVHGWNFCGGRNGQNIEINSSELGRVYHTWKYQFEGKKEKQISSEKKFLFQQWKKSVSIINEEYAEAYKNQTYIANLLSDLDQSSRMICKYLSKREFDSSQVKSLILDKELSLTMQSAAEFWLRIFRHTANSSLHTNIQLIKDLSEVKGQIDEKIYRKLQAPVDIRKKIIQDNDADINDRFYGNNNLQSFSFDHGTMVAGVIGARRTSRSGVDGIADSIQLMMIRAVPKGDEYDKDIALAIRYAVDNGAQIINMSFGKKISPFKQFIDDAIRYAASKNVLIVHGSGNDANDISKEVYYPNPNFLDGTTAKNFITVGASGDPGTGGYVAPFSNYSNQWVDIFAPGVFIYTTASDNTYNTADGTSLACPVVSGVAALLKSYFPSLKPEQIITIIKSSGTVIQDEVILPGTIAIKVKFSELSSSGRIVNAYEAVKLALSLEKTE